MIQGGTRQAHTVECRERFRELMLNEGKVQKTREKRKDYEERMAKKENRREDTKHKKEEERGRKRRAEDDEIKEERIQDAVLGGEGTEAESGGEQRGRQRLCHIHSGGER